MRVLVTGGAGFIGSHLVEALLSEGHQIRVLDNLDPYYDPSIKRANVQRWSGPVRFREGDILREEDLAWGLEGVDAVVHLAARAGVRPSLADPEAYIRTNVLGMQRLLEAMKARRLTRLVYASSSSVYGAREDGPFLETDAVRTPESPYAATKMAGELLCHAASRSWGLQASCMRLFTVYGPRQRPEMAISLFARALLQGDSIRRFGPGDSRRDYTYVSDIVQGLQAALERPRGFRVYNLGCGQPCSLNELLEAMADCFQRPLKIQEEPFQAGDVPSTWASSARAGEELGYRPQVSLPQGLRRFRDALSGE